MFNIGIVGTENTGVLSNLKKSIATAFDANGRARTI
jgi:hypothetical protein